MVVLAALLVAGAFKPIGLWPLAILGYVLFIRDLNRTRSPIWSAFIFGLISSLVILKWSDIYVGTVPYLALSLLQASFSIPLGVHVKFLGRKNWLPLTFLASEVLRELFPFGGFSWTQVGFSQIDAPYRHLAALGGVFLLSVLVVALASVSNRYQVLLIALLLLAGATMQSSTGEGSVRVAAIQGTTPNRTLNYAADMQQVFLRHFNLSRAVRGAEVIVWPEDVVDGNPTDKRYRSYFQMLRGSDLVIGNSPFVAGMPENLSTYIAKDGAIVSSYTKQALVPFGEYVPLRTIVRRLNSHVDEVIDYRPGQSTIIHKIDGRKFSSLICFEIIDNSVVKSAALKSQYLLAQTNTSTFRGTYEAEQQLAITRMRALEYSRPILSVSTVGYTAFIDNNGRVESQAVPNLPTILYGTMRESSGDTLYARFPYLSLIFVLFFGALGRRKR